MEFETGGGSADGGVDLILHREGERILVQCKHWRSSQVGVKLVQELHGLTHSNEHMGSRGIFVTFGTYTRDAKEFARENGIELVDRRVLSEMIKSAQNSGKFVEEQAPSCPKCGSSMVIRTAQRGNRAGSKFWGCSSYPTCRGIRNVEG